MAPIRRSKCYCGLSATKGICFGAKNEEGENYIRTEKIKRPARNIINRREVVPLVFNDLTKRFKEYIKNEFNGSEIKVLFQKHITQSDTRSCINRLNIPVEQVLTDDFLTEDEIQDLDMGMEIEVELVGPNLRMYEELLGFKVWSMSTSKNYVLKRYWSDFWEKNKVDLKVGELIQVWSFRVENRLCFAFVSVNKPVANLNLEIEE